MHNNYSHSEKSRKRTRMARIIAYTLSAVLVFSIINTNVLAQNVQAAPQKIISFAVLEKEIATQNIYVGDPESKITLPTTLNVILEATPLPVEAAKEASVETVTETPAEATAETVTETPTEAPQEATQSTEAVTSEAVPENATSENPAEGSSTIGDQGKSIIDYLWPSIKVYAATSAGTTNYTVISGIVWKIESTLSTQATFSSEKAGTKFVYVPVLPANYSTTAALPQIVVNVIAKPEAAPAQESAVNEQVAVVAEKPATEVVKPEEAKEEKQAAVADIKGTTEAKEEKAAEVKATEEKAEKKVEENSKKDEKKIEEKSKDAETKTEEKIEEKSEEKSEEKKDDKKEETVESKENTDKENLNKEATDKEDKEKEDKEKEEKEDKKEEDKDSLEKEASEKDESKTEEKTEDDKKDKSEKEAKTDKEGKEKKEDKGDKEEDKEEAALEYSEIVSGYVVSINAPEGVFPKGTTVSVKVVSNPRDLIEEELSDKRNIEEIVTFSISFLYKGKEIEPKDGSVDVSIVLAEDMKETLKNESAKVQVFHISDVDSIEEVKCDTDGKEVTFSADSFSEYTVVTSTGIDKVKLDTPNNVHWVDGETLTLAWNKVANADEYGISLCVDGETNWIQTFSTKNQIDLIETISSQESYYQKFFSGKKINVKVRAEINGSDKQKALKYSTGEYSEVVSKVYSRQVIIDPEKGVRIVETDAIYATLKNGLSASQAAQAAGKTLVFEITMDEISGTGDEAGGLNKFAVSKSYNIAKYLDISVTAKADGVNIGFVTQTPSEVPLVVDIPSKLQKSGRTFIILRNHEGTIAEVGRTTENKVTIKTNQFSAYAIAFVDKKTEEPANNNSNNDSDNNSSNNSSNNGEDQRIKALIEAYTWKPTTPDEKLRAGVVGKEVYKPYLDVTTGYTIHIRNAMQGPKCFAAFNVALDGYKIGRTYDILPNGYKTREMAKEATITFTIPLTLRKVGRDFRLICVTTNGQPVILKDLDGNPDTITVKTNKFYAFALVYKDSVSVK